MAYEESKEPVRCGVGWFSTGPDDPFIEACRWHDNAYLEMSWAQCNMSRPEVDAHFLAMMLVIAKGDVILEARAYMYYEIAKQFGSSFWEGTCQTKIQP